MPLDLQARADALKAGKTVKKVKAAWLRPTVSDLAQNRVLAFDQTVNHTGWVMFGVQDDSLTEWDHGTLAPADSDLYKGHADTLHRMLDMGRQIEATIHQWAYMGPTVILEMPAAHGYRIESSLLAAYEIQRVCREVGLDYVMVANQHMKKVITGGATATKAEVKAHAMEIAHVSGRWNQHNADALGLGLTFLWDRARALEKR